MPRTYSRRIFISHFLCADALFLGCLWSIAGCNSKKPVQENTTPAKNGDPCNDFSGVSESELDKRNKLGYVSMAAMPDKQCKTCKLYLPPRADEKCGGCMLFKGPVDANGSCTYWAPLV